jgi:hypothetical protein
MEIGDEMRVGGNDLSSDESLVPFYHIIFCLFSFFVIIAIHNYIIPTIKIPSSLTIFYPLLLFFSLLLSPLSPGLLEISCIDRQPLPSLSKSLSYPPLSSS